MNLKMLPKFLLILAQEQSKQLTSSMPTSYITNALRFWSKYIIQMTGDRPFSFETPPDIFVLFSRKFINHIPTPNPEDVWCLCLRSPEDIFQLDAILAILKEEHKKSKLPHIFITLHHLLEFEDRSVFADWIKSHIQSKYKYTILKNELEYNALVYKHKDKDWNISKQDRGSVVFWKKFCALPFFSSSCPWRRCAFCNIWKSGVIYTKDIDKKKEIVRKNINFLRENQYDAFWIIDPSITLDDLLIIADVFEEENFSIPMHIRTRYDERYKDKDICRRLGKMWASYLWTGLESASPRMNKLMNKYRDNPTKEDFDIMTRNCLEAGIRIHHYVVIWFPWETKEDLDITRDYLISCLHRFRDKLYSYTSSVFEFSHWTDISKYPEKYNITIPSQGIKGDIRMSNNRYIENDIDSFLIQYRSRTSFNLFAYQFFGTVQIKKDVKWLLSIWNFIERLHFLRIQKFFLEENPYEPEKMQAWLQKRWLLLTK